MHNNNIVYGTLSSSVIGSKIKHFLFQMNFYKYQNKLMSICEKLSFKCAECYQSFLTQADLQCHVYDHHRQQKDAPPTGQETKNVKQEISGCAVNGNADETRPLDGCERAENPIKVEDEDEVSVKTERREREDEDEEMIDVGENNRSEIKSGTDEEDADMH